MRLLRLLLPVCFIGVGLLLASCGARSDVRLVYISANADLPAFVAQELHLFEKRGLRVSLIRANDSSEALTALVAGQADAAAGLTFGVYFPAEIEDPGKLILFQPFAETDHSVMSYLLASPQANNIRSVADLRGKRIGTYTGASQLVYLKLFLQKVGIDPEKDVTIVQVGMDLQGPALQAGQFDALFTVEPYGTLTVREARARVILENPRSKYILDPFWVGAAAMRVAWARDHRDAARRLREAFDEAAEAIERDPEGMKKLLTHYTPLDEEQAVKSGLYEWFTDAETKGQVEGIQKLADLMHERALISKAIPNIGDVFRLGE